MIPSSVMLKLRKHKYLENEFIYSLKIDECKYQYQVFEKVFGTIAEAHNMYWKDIFHASHRSLEKYTLLCVSTILIDKLLRTEFHLTVTSRELLLGTKLNEIVRDYYKFI
jgi:hypothetical protein